MSREDARIAYGARCTWWGDISTVGTVDRGSYTLPCCPHCRGMLFEVPSRADWDGMVDKYAASGAVAGYKDLMSWAEGRCFPNFAALTRAYLESKT